MKELESENSEWALQQLKTMRKMVSRQSFSSVFLGVIRGEPYDAMVSQREAVLRWGFIYHYGHMEGQVSERVVLKEQCSCIRMVLHKGGLSSKWSFIKVVFHQGGLSSRWSFIRVVFHQGGLSSGWSFIRVVFQVVFHQVFHHGLSSGWSLHA